MRFDEADVREAYRSGARDCFECLADRLNKREARQLEAWREELESWDYSDPPPVPLI
jgi:hypothetical protein